MSEESSKITMRQIEKQIKPILEKLSYNILKDKPDNIVRNIFYLNSFISPYLWLNILKN